MKTICFLDTETTSTEPSTGRLVEVGIVLWSVPHRAIIRSRSWLLEGETNEAEAVNGIPAALLSHGVPFEDVERQLHAIILKEADAVFCWNVEFDRAWFSPHMQSVKPWVCAMDDCDYPRATTSKGLTAVALAHGVGVVDAHRALADCMTMARLFERVAEGFDAIDHGMYDTAGSKVRPRFVDWLARAARPRAIFEVADKRFDEARNAKAKELGFRWQPETKSWRRRLAREDAKGLPFDVREVRA